jgi:uncharacterized protein
MNPDLSTNACNPTIAIIGFSVRAAAQCATRQGLKVIAVDMCGDRDLIEACEDHCRLDDPNWPERLVKLAPTAPLLLAGGMENRIALIDQCHKLAPRLGAAGTQIKSLRQLENWERWARSSGIQWPRTARNASEFAAFVERSDQCTWLLKSTQSCGGMGIQELCTLEAMRYLASVEASQSQVNYIQERLPGVSIGVTFLSSEFGSVVIGATVAWQDKELDVPYKYTGSYGPIGLSQPNMDRLESFAELAQRDSQIKGLWQADFLIHDGELTLLEINPRWSASMDILNDCLGLPLVRLHVDCLGCTLNEATLHEIEAGRRLAPTPRLLGKRIIYADRPFVVTSEQSEYWWSKRWIADSNWKGSKVGFADIPFAGMELRAGDPVLTINQCKASDKVWLN